MDSKTPAFSLVLRGETEKPKARSAQPDTTREDLAKFKAEVDRLKAESAAARYATEQLRHDIAASKRTTNLRLGAAAALLVTVGFVSFTWVSSHKSDYASPISTEQIPGSPAIRTRVSTTDNETQAAIVRLRNALNSFPDQEPEAILRKVNQRHGARSKPCPLNWSGDLPTLSVGRVSSGAPLSMATALNQCSDAIEELSR
jgi:hypothetical protein